MSELRELYQEVILDHNKHPRNFREIPDGRYADGYNPMCGDRIRVYVRTRDGVIDDVAFKGAGCAISQASASLMTERLKGTRVEEAEGLFGQFHSLVVGEGGEGNYPLEKLEVFSQVSEYPVRVKCASLAWHTLKEALECSVGSP